LQAAPGFGVKLANGEWVKLETREPEAEYRVLRQQWQRQLNCHYEEDQKARAQGVIIEWPVCLPINEAIEALFKGPGLPVRTQDKNSQNPEISLPTAASSGRVTGKGKE
jgi:hypothetical protein